MRHGTKRRTFLLGGLAVEAQRLLLLLGEGEAMAAILHVPDDETVQALAAGEGEFELSDGGQASYWWLLSAE